jgi:hypothetical protein
MFILTLAVDYEGETVLGAYSSRELAEAASETFAANRSLAFSSDESFIIHEITVDAPAEYQWG